MSHNLFSSFSLHYHQKNPEFCFRIVECRLDFDRIYEFLIQQMLDKVIMESNFRRKEIKFYADFPSRVNNLQQTFAK